jgi:hypothetical protein
VIEQVFDLPLMTTSTISINSLAKNSNWTKAIDTLVIRPSERMDAIAASHARELLRAMRFLARRLGVTDGMSQRAEILDFSGYADTRT